MSHERDTRLAPAGRSTVQSRQVPGNAVMRLQQGIGNRAVGARLARDAKQATRTKQVAPPRKHRAPYIEIEKVGLIEIPEGGVDFSQTRTIEDDTGEYRVPVRRTNRIAPATVGFTLPLGSEQSRVLQKLMDAQVEGRARAPVGVLGLPALYGHEATEVAVEGVLVSSMSMAKGGSEKMVRWELALDGVTMPDWWYETKTTDVRGSNPDVKLLGPLGIPAR